MMYLWPFLEVTGKRPVRLVVILPDSERLMHLMVTKLVWMCGTRDGCTSGGGGGVWPWEVVLALCCGCS